MTDTLPNKGNTIAHKTFIFWNNLKFINKQYFSFTEDILAARFITVPSAPVLTTSSSDINLYNALYDSTFSIVDSSLFALLCRLKLIKVYKYSGYKLINALLYFLQHNDFSILLVDPSVKSARINRQYLLKVTRMKEDFYHNYIAPIYPNNEEITDYKLLNILESVKPRIILLGIAGGKQEILGRFLSKNLSFKTTILCTGAALSFFTKEQAPINDLIDKLGLGWVARIYFNPNLYLLRYIKAFKFIYLFFKYPLITYKK